jgi:hypothetical protein
VSTDPETGTEAVPGRAPSASACEPYRELIERALEYGRNAMAIWHVNGGQELRNPDVRSIG